MTAYLNRFWTIGLTALVFGGVLFITLPKGGQTTEAQAIPSGHVLASSP